MSYILEALQEAQKSRDDARVPNLRSVHVEPKATSQVGNKWLAYLTVAAVLMIGGLGLGWWMNESEQPLVNGQAVATGALRETPPVAESSAVTEVAVQPDFGVNEPAVSKAVADDPAQQASVADDPEIDSPEVSVAVVESPPVRQQMVIQPDTGSEPAISAAQSLSEIGQRELGNIAPAPVIPSSHISSRKPMASATESITVSGSLPASEPSRSEAEEAISNVEQLAIDKLQPEQIARVEVKPLVQSMETTPGPDNQLSNSTIATTETVETVELDQQMQQSAPAPAPHFRELPFDVQQSLPAIAYSVHLYAAEPAHRMVKIDGRVRREGDTVKPGLVLEEITPTGAIFSFRDNVFRVPVNG